MDPKVVKNNFTYHKPTEKTIPKYETIREEGKTFSEKINDMCPESREKSIALRKIEEAVMWANASVARNE